MTCAATVLNVRPLRSWSRPVELLVLAFHFASRAFSAASRWFSATSCWFAWRNWSISVIARRTCDASPDLGERALDRPERERKAAAAAPRRRASTRTPSGSARPRAAGRRSASRAARRAVREDAVHGGSSPGARGLCYFLGGRAYVSDDQDPVHLVELLEHDVRFRVRRTSAGRRRCGPASASRRRCAGRGRPAARRRRPARSPWSMMSATSSGGVSSIVSLIVSTICATDGSIASRIWSAPTSTERGSPVNRSRPRSVTRCASHSPGAADAIAILMSSAVRSPRSRLYSRRANWTMSSSISSPPIRIERETTMPPRRDHGDLGRAAADVDDQRTRRLADRQPCADRGGHRLLDQPRPARTGS